ncbi:CxxxxCH/CxxCH domain-containing protein [Nocardioides sp. LMS-CY]|nr:CxxxxCH/CxxCH domain-containing protein [Nocardioides sp. LMS-CY]
MPSSACHSSGGRSSSTTAMPTWLTGALVTSRIA